jgi:predicted Na+-dependent transporter
MEFLSKAIPVTIFVFVVSSTLSAGFSLAMAQILIPLRNAKLIFVALLANFVLMPLGALAIARLLVLDRPLAAVCFWSVWPPAHRCSLSW